MLSDQVPKPIYFYFVFFSASRNVRYMSLDPCCRKWIFEEMVMGYQRRRREGTQMSFRIGIAAAVGVLLLLLLTPACSCCS